ncbi:hypothetical protein Lesp02_58820 [Lentzea sp. NBRC 105346]|nr:hypothetical protein Lesp02_58820 [Lentzea sp. NBRC 105346]
MGRARELELLRAARGRVVLVVGEAGIGKSALVAHLDAVVGRAVADEGAPEFWPWLRVLDGVGLSRDLLTVDPLPGESRAAARFRAITRCADELRGTAHTIVLEDLHWADDASIRLLAHLSIEDGPTVIATSREMMDVPNARIVRLGPLSLTDVAEYAGPQHAEELLRRSGGNPLYLRLLSTTDSNDGELAHLVKARLEPLRKSTRELLDRAAVVGDDVDLDLIGEEGLDEAIAAGLLTDDPASPHTVRWSHTLLREAVYDALPRRRRIELHRQLAERTTGTDRARHLLRGGTKEEARAACREVGWFERALPLADTDAERAELHLDIAEQLYQEGLVMKALDHCERASDLGDADVTARAAVVVRDVQGEAVDRIVALCVRARELLGDEDSARHAKVLAQQAKLLADTRGRAHVRPLTARALEMADRSGDPDAIVSAMKARLLLVDSVAEVLQLGSRMIATGKPENALWGHAWRIDGSFWLGAIDQIDAELAELGGLADRMRWPLARWHHTRSRAARAELVGRFAEAERLALECRDIAMGIEDGSAIGLFYSFTQQLARFTGDFDKYELPEHMAEIAMYLPIYLSANAMVSVAKGDRDAVRFAYERLCPMIPTMPDELRWPNTGMFTAQVALWLGELEFAPLLYDNLLPLKAYYANQSPGCEGSVSRVLGMLAAALGRTEDAVAHLNDAIAMEKRIGALPFLAMAQFELAKVTRRDELLESAVRIARHLGMKPLVKQIEALTAIPLTAREQEIALMLADGLANKAIAAKLVLSERTVETHVRNLLLKLGLENRTQVAGWVVRSGLTWSH